MTTYYCYYYSRGVSNYMLIYVGRGDEEGGVRRILCVVIGTQG
jgi:hypothetical protein